MKSQIKNKNNWCVGLLIPTVNNSIRYESLLYLLEL